MLEINKVYNMDCLDGMRLIDDCSIDLIITDPPFNQDKSYEQHNDSLPGEVYIKWCEKWISEAFRVLKLTGSFYVQINSKNLINIGKIIDKHGILQNICIWIKHSSPPIQKNRYSKNYQPWLFYTKTDNYKFYNDREIVNSIYEPYKNISGRNTNTSGRNTNISGRNNNGRIIDDIWEDIPELVSGYLAQKEVLLNDDKTRKHLQQMPISLARRMIYHSSDKNDIVLDTFMGSGTTAIACLETNRNFIGFENGNIHYKDCIDRIKNYNSQTRL